MTKDYKKSKQAENGNNSDDDDKVGVSDCNHLENGRGALLEVQQLLVEGGESILGDKSDENKESKTITVTRTNEYTRKLKDPCLYDSHNNLLAINSPPTSPQTHPLHNVLMSELTSSDYLQHSLLIETIYRGYSLQTAQEKMQQMLLPSGIQQLLVGQSRMKVVNKGRKCLQEYQDDGSNQQQQQSEQSSSQSQLPQQQHIVNYTHNKNKSRITNNKLRLLQLTLSTNNCLPHLFQKPKQLTDTIQILLRRLSLMKKLRKYYKQGERLLHDYASNIKINEDESQSNSSSLSYKQLLQNMPQLMVKDAFNYDKLLSIQRKIIKLNEKQQQRNAKIENLNYFKK